MGQCTVCGDKASFLMSMCNACLSAGPKARAASITSTEAPTSAVTCSSCRQVLPSSAQYCPSCGQARAALAPAASSTAIVVGDVPPPVVSTTRPDACPNCGALTVQAVVKQVKSARNALVGELLFGTAVGVTAGTSTNTFVACLACGAEWPLGNRASWKHPSLTEAEAAHARQTRQSQAHVAMLKAKWELQAQARKRQMNVVVWTILLLLGFGIAVLLGTSN